MSVARSCVYLARRATKSGHPILLSYKAPDVRLTLTIGLKSRTCITRNGRERWPVPRSEVVCARVLARPDPCTCENPFREGEGRCQTVFLAERTEGSKKHVPRTREKKVEKEVTRTASEEKMKKKKGKKESGETERKDRTKLQTPTSVHVLSLSRRL